MTASDPTNGSATSQPGSGDDGPPSSQQPASGAAPDSTPPASGDAPPSSSAPDSTKDDSGDCAEIPTAAHAVLQADIELQVRIPRTVDEVKQMPHKLTLTSDDGSVSQTLPVSGAVACDIDGTSMITFTGLAEHHSYALQIDNGDTTYVVFTNEAYEQIGEDDDDGSSDPSPPDDSGGTGDNGTTAAA
jgi:hypothetical protein